MKRTIPVIAVVIAAVIALVSFKPVELAPRLYPELEAYFKTVNVKEFNKEHVGTLENLKYDIYLSHLDKGNWNVIFYCSENTFRSQASEVFAQTLCYAKKHKQIRVFSAGVSSGEISTKLIEYLSKIGYRITKTEKEGKAIYEVRFSDKADPIVLFSKTTTDISLPTKDVRSVIVCDIKAEAECAAIKTQSVPLNLAFKKVNETDDTEKIQSTLKNIAAEMLYVTGKQ